MSNADIDALSAEDLYKEFRLIWRGTETILTDEVSMFTRGRGKCTMIIISGAHGTERAGPIALLRWAKKLADLKVNGKICVIPIMHPRAWDLRLRSPGRLNMNRVWNESKCHRAIQVKKVMRLLRTQAPSIFLDFHGDDEIKDDQPYIFRASDCLWGKELQRAVGVSTLKGISRKLDYQTSESYAYSLGINKSFTVETCPFHHIDQQVEFDLGVLDYCFRFANNKENWR